MMRRFQNSFSRFVLNIPAGVLSGLVFWTILWLTLAPHPLPEEDLPMFPGMDKVAHACMFGGFYFIMVLDSVTWRFAKCVKRSEQLPAAMVVNVPKMLVVIFAVASCALGGVIEIVQDAMNMGRGGDIFDFCADVAGVALAVWLSPKVLRLMYGTRIERM